MRGQATVAVVQGHRGMVFSGILGYGILRGLVPVTRLEGGSVRAVAPEVLRRSRSIIRPKVPAL